MIGHPDAMTLRHRSLRPRPLRAASLIAAALLVVAGLAGCSADDEDPDQPSASASPTVGSTDYLPVPDGVELTPQGSDLALGEPAVVAWQPAADKVGVLELAVTRIEKVDMDRLSSWDLDKQTRTATPYFVHAAVHNIGGTNLSQAPIPLYLADGEDALVPASTFESLFRPCPSQGLPEKFKTGQRTSLCQVYLLAKGGDFAGVSFYTGPGFDPITWTGQVSKPKPEQPDQKKSDDQQGNG